MLNSYSLITPSLRDLDTTLSNTTNAGIMMSINFITFLNFCWYFLVSTEIVPLAIAPVIDAAPNTVLTRISMNVANVATLDIPVATLIPLEQAFNHVSQFNILLYCLYFFLNITSLSISPRLLALIMLRWYGTCGGASTGGPWALILGADGRIGYVLQLIIFINE